MKSFAHVSWSNDVTAEVAPQLVSRDATATPPHNDSRGSRLCSRLWSGTEIQVFYEDILLSPSLSFSKHELMHIIMHRCQSLRANLNFEWVSHKIGH